VSKKVERERNYKKQNPRGELPSSYSEPSQQEAKRATYVARMSAASGSLLRASPVPGRLSFMMSASMKTTFIAAHAKG